MNRSMPSVLARIVAETRAEVQRRQLARPLSEPREQANAPGPGSGRSLREAINGDGVGVIAEFKRRSPSAGALAEQPDLLATLDAYERGGAIAVSVLTEGPNFDGSLDDLERAREASRLPLLRKDFIVDPYQLHEARAAGADAVLLIVAALDPAALADLHRGAAELGLEVLIEVHDPAELETALAIEPDLIGVNNRDLRDFSVDLARTERLLELIPQGVSVVSESGIAGAEQVRRLGELGVQAVLVGESLMRAPDPAAALRALRQAA